MNKKRLSDDMIEDRIIFSALAGIAVFFILGMILMARDRYEKIAKMPAEIRYEVAILNTNDWPDRFYSASYPGASGSDIVLPAFWTFEISKHPFGISKWVFHDAEIKINKDNASIQEIIRR